MNDQSMQNRLYTYIVLNTRGDQRPEKICINTDDFKEFYAELKKIQRYNAFAIQAPFDKTLAGYSAVLFSGSAIICNPEAPPLPKTCEEMHDWLNVPFQIKTESKPEPLKKEP
jgi:hypothetical protein